MLAIFRELVRNHPELSLLAVGDALAKLGQDILAGIEGGADAVWGLLKAAWEMERQEPWPGMPEMPLPHPQGPPTDDPFKP